MAGQLTKNPKYYFLNWLSHKNQTRILHRMVRMHADDRMISLSSLCKSTRNILFVFPEDPLEAVLQFPTLSALQNHFSPSQARLLCRSDIAELVQGSPHVPHILSYEPEATLLFGPALRYWIKTLREHRFEICIFLDRQVDLKRYYLCAASGIPLRITYSSPSSDLFFNVTVRPQAQNGFIGEKNFCLAACLGIPRSEDRYEWILEDSKRRHALEFLSRLGLADSRSLVALSDGFEEPLVRELLAILRRRGKKALFMTGSRGNHQKLRQLSGDKEAFFCPALPFDEAVSMLCLCEGFISDPRPLLYLSAYAKIPSIGVFKAEEPDQWAHPAPSFGSVVHAPDAKESARRIMDQFERLCKHRLQGGA